MTAPAISVLEYHLVSYRRTWRGTVLSSFVMPVLFVVGFGLSVGKLVDAGGRLGPVSYLQFIAPGMIATTAMQVALGSAMFPVMARFRWIKTYHAMAAAPLRVSDILGGDYIFLAIRAVTTSAIFLVISALFGAIQSWWGVLVLPIAALLGLACGTPLMALAASIDTTVPFSLVQRFLVVPMSLFAGVYFSVESLSPAVRWLAYISPLWHGVELCRAATTTAHGTLLAAAGHVAYLAAWALVGCWLAQRAFTRQLSD